MADFLALTAFTGGRHAKVYWTCLRHDESLQTFFWWNLSNPYLCEHEHLKISPIISHAGISPFFFFFFLFRTEQDKQHY